MLLCPLLCWAGWRLSLGQVIPGAVSTRWTRTRCRGAEPHAVSPPWHGALALLPHAQWCRSISVISQLGETEARSDEVAEESSESCT